MGRQSGEPLYPHSEAELMEYCGKFILALKRHLEHHLICVLLNGSWARGEANPPISDVDMTLVVDKITDDTSNALRAVWIEVNMGCVNVVDLAELQAKPKELIAMLSDTCKVLYGTNPFTPSKQDYANNVSDAASNIGLYARTIEYYHWKTIDDKISDLKYVMTSKYNLKWLLKNLMAFRNGTFPANEEQLLELLKNEPEQELYSWSKQFTDEDYRKKYSETARMLSLYVSKWLEEVSDFVR